MTRIIPGRDFTGHDPYNEHVARAGYVDVTLKEGVAQLIDRFIAENDEGFTSRSEVVSAAVRDFVARREQMRLDRARLADE